MGAATVVYDILFPEPDRISPKNLQNFFGDQPENSELSNALALLPDSDAMLAESTARVPSVAAFALLENGSVKSSVTAKACEKSASRVSSSVDKRCGTGA